MENKILTNEQRKARKNYPCWLCREEIRKGNQYIYETYVYDGHIYTNRRHIHCDAVMCAWINRYGTKDEYTDGEIIGGIWEDVCVAICDAEQREECNYTTSFSCKLCQKELLNPSLLGVAVQSVKENEIGL